MQCIEHVALGVRSLQESAVTAQNFGSAVAGDAGKGPIDIENGLIGPGGVGDHYAVAAVLDDGCAAQIGLCGDPGADVAHHHQDTVLIAIQRCEVDFQRKTAAVQPLALGLAQRAGLRRIGCFQHGTYRVPARGTEQLRNPDAAQLPGWAGEESGRCRAAFGNVAGVVQDEDTVLDVLQNPSPMRFPLGQFRVGLAHPRRHQVEAARGFGQLIVALNRYLIAQFASGKALRTRSDVVQLPGQVHAQRQREQGDQHHFRYARPMP